MKMSNSEHAKIIIEKSISFDGIVASGFFPSIEVLNDFLMYGHDCADQDDLMPKWRPFKLSQTEFEVVLSWWQTLYPDAKVSNLGVKSNNHIDWFAEAYEQ
tara:strand:- start:53 stop:355 length:303 start_codon:yes stop_codon:yes gene_type:complete